MFCCLKTKTGHPLTKVKSEETEPADALQPLHPSLERKGFPYFQRKKASSAHLSLQNPYDNKTLTIIHEFITSYPHCL